MTLHAQDFLRTRTLADLKREHGINYRLSADARKVSLNYDQIASKPSDPLACQCRGLILARAGHEPFDDGPVGDTFVVARPFDRFFNQGANGADIDALFARPGVRVFEKCDGTLAIVHYDRRQMDWCVATRSVPEADVAIDGFGTHTFRSLFEHAVREQFGMSFEEYTARLDSSLTYLYELTTPENIVVVRYAAPQIHLLGMRDTETGEERCPVERPIPLVPPHHAATHALGSLADLIAHVAALSPQEREGVVVRAPGSTAGSFERVKLKNPAYGAINMLRDLAMHSPRALMTVILSGKEDDVFPMIPASVAKIGETYRDKFALMSRTCDEQYLVFAAAAAASDNPRKAMALAAQAAGGYVPYFMERFTGQVGSFREFVDARRDETGGWKDGFLDSLMNQMRNTNE